MIDWNWCKPDEETVNRGVLALIVAGVLGFLGMLVFFGIPFWNHMIPIAKEFWFG